MTPYKPGWVKSFCRKRRAAIALGLSVNLLFTSIFRPQLGAEEVRPKNVTPDTLKAVHRGLDYLARTQADDGAWRDTAGGQAYPVSMTALAAMALLANGNSPTRGKYSKNLQQATDYLVKCSQKDTGLITSASQEQGRPMYGHGFALMYLSIAYGMETKESRRTAIRDAVNAGIKLTAQGQSAAGGWMYTPGSGDEGSVTVTQIQALRAAHNAGFEVPKSTIEKAVQYIEKCNMPDGGICYSLGSGGGSCPAISAAATATLYNAGEYDAPVAKRCLKYVWNLPQGKGRWIEGIGHDYYANYYAAQAYYMEGDEYWDEYFPKARDRLLQMQDKSDGSWQGDGIGKVYGTSIALVILQLPYKFLPVYQR